MIMILNLSRTALKQVQEVGGESSGQRQNIVADAKSHWGSRNNSMGSCTDRSQECCELLSPNGGQIIDILEKEFKRAPQAGKPG